MRRGSEDYLRRVEMERSAAAIGRIDEYACNKLVAWKAVQDGESGHKRPPGATWSRLTTSANGRYRLTPGYSGE